MKMNLVHILTLVVFSVCGNANAATTRIYDEKGLLKQDGDYTWVYDYYEDRTIKSRTKLDGSGNAVYKDVYEYDAENKTITKKEYENASAVSNNSVSIQDVFKYDTPEKFLSAQSDVSKLNVWFTEGGNGPLGSTERYRTFYNGESWGAGTVFNSYDEQGRLTGTYVCGSNSTCITNARNGNYDSATIKRKYEYSTDEEGKVTVTQKRGPSWYTEATFQYKYDEYGNIIKAWNNGSVKYTATYNDPNWRVNQAKTNKEHDAKRIYTVEEATAAVKGNKNTFSIRYR